MTAERESLRLFAAVDLPDDWRAELEQIQLRQQQVSPGYFRLVAPRLMHLTLVFMGSQPASRLAAIEAAVGRAATEVPPFRLALGRVATFGPARAPRVLWVEALQPDGRLQQLRRALEDELRAAGVSFDDKPLRPHVTLARSRGSAGGPVRVLEARPTSPPHLVRRIVLFESQLSRNGPEYRALAEFGLGSSSGQS